jgi:integrase
MITFWPSGNWRNSRSTKPKDAVLTFRKVAERYIKDIIPTKARATQKDNARELLKLYQFFDNPPAPLEQIKPIHIRQYLDWRGTAAATRAKREKALFSHIWNMAREWGYTDLPNPCTGIKGHSTPGRKVYIEQEVYQAVWDAADPPLRDALDLAYLTGQREADLLKMRETDLRDGNLELTQNKTGAKLRIAITGQLAGLIQRIQARKAQNTIRPFALLVIEDGQPMTYNMLRGRFDKARAKAAASNPHIAEAVAGFQFRDLRAKAATDKAEASGIHAAQKQLGHTTIAMTGHYVRGRLGDKTEPTK